MDDLWERLEVMGSLSGVAEAVEVAYKALGCAHDATREVFILRELNRHLVLRVRCQECGSDAVVKGFNWVREDEDGNRASFDRERSTLEAFNEGGLAPSKIRAPRLLGSWELPRPIIIESFVELPSLLVLIREAVKSADSSELMGALTVLGQGLAELHENTVKSEGWLESLEDSIDFVRRNAPTTDGAAEREHLESLHQKWIQNNWFRDHLQSALIHDDPTPCNILYSADDKVAVLLDFEASHWDSPFADIGAVCAELKYNFKVQAWNTSLAEPVIGCFLRSYFDRQSFLEMSFADFCRVQAFFMGRRLLWIGLGRHVDPHTRTWCRRETAAIWQMVDSLGTPGPAFRDIEGVLFDFYNTMVCIRTDESDIVNFRCVAKLLSQVAADSHVACELNESVLRDEYFSAVKQLLADSDEEYPEIRMREVWENVLLRVCPGLSYRELWRDDKKLLRQILEEFRESSIRHFSVAARLRETIVEIKERGIKVGIVTNAQPYFVERELEKVGILDLLDCIVISGNFGCKKPAKRLFNAALRELGLQGERVVFVGDDMFSDIFGAQAVGMPAVYKPSAAGARYYGATKPDAVVKDLSEIPGLLQ